MSTTAALEAGRLVVAAVDGAMVYEACSLSRMLFELPPSLPSPPDQPTAVAQVSPPQSND